MVVVQFHPVPLMIGKTWNVWVLSEREIEGQTCESLTDEEKESIASLYAERVSCLIGDTWDEELEACIEQVLASREKKVISHE